MSLALKVFSENFLRGMQLGTSWQDKSEDREIKRSTLRYQLAKMEQDAAFKRAHLANEAQKTGGYLEGIGARAALDRAKAGNVGKGKGAAGPDPNVQAFALDPRVNEPSLATPPAQAGGTTAAAPAAEDNTPVAPPPASDYGDSDSSDTTLARGGRVPRYADGGGVMQSRLRYQVRRDEQSARVAQPTTRLSRPLRAPSFDPVPRMARGGPVALHTRPPMLAPGAGTSGPGSGYGEIAAPPPRYADGGEVDGERLFKPQATPGMADVSVGGGRASFGATYDPNSRYGAVEAGYEHPVGRNMTLGVQGNVGKDLGPDGASARPNWGVGVRGRIRFADGGPVDAMAQANDAMVRRNTGMADQSIAARRAGGAAGGSANGATGSGGDAAGGVSGTGGVGGSATDGAGGSAAAGVGGDDGGTYRRGGSVSRYAYGGTVADPVENMWNSYYRPQQSQPAQGGVGGRALSSFGSAAMGGINKTIEGKGAYNQDPRPLPRPTIQRTSSTPYDGGVPGTDTGTYAGGGTVVNELDDAPRRQESADTLDDRYPNQRDTNRRLLNSMIRQRSEDGTDRDMAIRRQQPQGAIPRFADGGNTDMRFPPDKDKITYDADGKPIWNTDDGPRRPMNPEYGGAKPGGAKFGGHKFGGNKYGGATPGGNKEGGDTYGGETYGGLRHTEPAPQPDPPPAYEPGDTGTLPPPDPVMPPTTAVASAPRGRGGPPRRLLLGDQRREAAYDPEADRMDPRNTGIVEPGGGVNERVWRATPEAHPDAYPDDNKGMFGERLDRPGPYPVAADATTGSAINIGAPTTSSTAMGNYAAKGASRYASNTFQGQDEHALFAGKGGATHLEMADIFKIVDPDNKMPMHEKMLAAQKASHDFWMSKNDPKQADQAAFEVGQFGNTMARQHGAKAAKALQDGDEKGALNEVLAGYGWLPDGGTPQVQNNAIIIRGPDGSVQTTIPLQPGTLHNLALGMATGQLGWDVMHAAAGKQPSGPTAQPQAASAGPQPNLPPQGSGGPPGSPAGSGPQVAQAQPAPQQPVPARPAPAPAPAPAAPGPAPAQMGPEGGAISTAPPTAPAAPAPTQVPPTARAPAPAPSSPPLSQGQGQGVPAKPGQPPAPTQPQQKTPEQLKAENDDAEQAHWAKNPYAPVREPSSPEQKRDQAIAQARHEQILSEQGIVAAANEHGLAGKGKLSTAVTQAIAAKKKIFDDKVKMAETDYRNDQVERAKNNQLRPMSLTDYTSIDGTLNTRAQQWAKATAGSPQAKARDDSVLRYASLEDQRTIKQIATGIFQNNKGVGPEQALDLALTATSILRPQPGDTDVGQNRQKGGKATRFKPSNRGDKGLTYLTFGDGTSIKVDNRTYQAIANQHHENWRQWAQSQTKEGQQAERDKKMGLNWHTAGAALRASTALMPGVPLITEGLGGIIGSFNRGR